MRLDVAGRPRRGREGFAYGLLAGQEVEELLDYGCGNASFALDVSDAFGLPVHACDIADDLIETLRGKHGSKVNFFAVSDEPDLPLADGAVSTVTCCDVIEHIPGRSRPRVLGEMHRVLRDDGFLVVTVPHKGPLGSLDPENFKFRFPRIHKAIYVRLRGRAEYERNYGGAGGFGNFSAGATRHEHFSRSELERLLATAGFVVEEVRYARLVYPFVRIALWLAQNLSGRIWGMSRLTSWLWRAYAWDAGLEPGWLGCFIGVRARRVAR
jgi:SAM-dependent methyltransferase